MRKSLFAGVLFLGFGLAVSALAEVIETASKVTEAIIYTDSTQITRQAEVNVKEGLNEVIFTNVPENLAESTLTVSAKGTAWAKILDAKIKKVFLERPESERVRQLEDKIREAENKISELNNQQSTIKQEQEFLKSIKLFAAQQIPEDLVTKMPKTEELNSLTNFLKEKWQGIFAGELEIKKELRRRNEELEKLKKELSLLHQARRKEKRVISIELDVEKAGGLTVTVSYLMYQANWYPEYDARVDYGQQKVELVCLGIVKQTSGADWQNVELTLSTAKPTVSGKMPELRPWFLRPYRPHFDKVGKDKVLSYAPKMMKRMESIAGAPAPEQKLKEEEAAPLYAQAQQKLTSVNYKIARLVDIKADGTKHRLPLFSHNFPAKFQYSTVPKLSPFAYLLAKVANETEQLLPASLRIFLDNAYVGSSVIEAVGKGEKFDLYLGIDEGVKAKREKIKEETKEVWIAGIKRRSKVTVATYKITVENYKEKDIKINVFDQIPVSQSDQIVIKVLEINPKPDEENYEDKKGVMRWELDIAPRQKKEITFTYQLEYPRNMNIGR